MVRPRTDSQQEHETEKSETDTLAAGWLHSVSIIAYADDFESYNDIAWKGQCWRYRLLPWISTAISCALGMLRHRMPPPAEIPLHWRGYQAALITISPTCVAIQCIRVLLGIHRVVV